MFKEQLTKFGREVPRAIAEAGDSGYPFWRLLAMLGSACWSWPSWSTPGWSTKWATSRVFVARDVFEERLGARMWCDFLHVCLGRFALTVFWAESLGRSFAPATLAGRLRHCLRSCFRETKIPAAT